MLFLTDKQPLQPGVFSISCIDPRELKKLAKKGYVSLIHSSHVNYLASILLESEITSTETMTPLGFMKGSKIVYFESNHLWLYTLIEDCPLFCDVVEDAIHEYTKKVFLSAPEEKRIKYLNSQTTKKERAKFWKEVLK